MKCENYLTVPSGPHPGCSEFAPDIVVSCTDDAVFRMTFYTVEELTVPNLGIDCVLVNVHPVNYCLACMKAQADGAVQDPAVSHFVVAPVGQTHTPGDRPGNFIVDIATLEVK